MLIRSQDKRTLTNFMQLTDLNINKNQNYSMYCVMAYYPHTIGDDYASMTLGKYSTEEQALEVLNEIQNIYQYAMNYKYGGAGAHHAKFVYEMPQDRGFY